MVWQRWIRTVEVAPGLDAGGAAVISGQVEALLRTGARIVHVDVGDEFTGSAAALSTLVPLVHRYEGVVDVHLTAGNPLLLFGAAAGAGADSVTFAADAVDDAGAAIQAARDTGVQVGVALADDTLAQQVHDADLVLAPCDAALVRRLRLALPSTCEISVEGPEVDAPGALPPLYEAGARVFVVREAIFSREDLPRAWRRLVQDLA
jgi:pentose-5-phosphate-3-epimerase